MSGTGTEQNKDTSRLPSLPPPSLPGMVPGLAPPSQPVTPRRPALAPPTLPPLAVQPLMQPAPVLTFETPVLPSIESASDDAFFAAAEFQLDVSNSSAAEESTELDYTFGLPAILDVTPQNPNVDTEFLNPVDDLTGRPDPLVDNSVVLDSGLLQSTHRNAPLDGPRTITSEQVATPAVASIDSPAGLTPTLAPTPAAAAVAPHVQVPVPDFVPTEMPPAAAIPSPVQVPVPEFVPAELPAAPAVAPHVEDPVPDFVPTETPTVGLVALPVQDLAPEVVSTPLPVAASPIEVAPAAPSIDPPHATVAAAQGMVGLPSLPNAGISPPAPSSAGPALGTQSSQAGMRAPLAMLEPLAPAAVVAAKTPRRPVRAIVRSLAAVLLAGGVGAGAHLGYDWWESGDAAVAGEIPVDASDLAAWPVVDPPAIRYADSVTVVRDVTGDERVVTSHLEIASGSILAEVDVTDAAGVSLGQRSVEIRGEEALTQLTPGAAFTPTTRAEALATLGDTWGNDIYSVRELFPTALMPYATVLESVERVLPVAPLVAPAALVEGTPEAVPESTVPIATSTTPSSNVWQYRVIIDVEAFRSNDMAAYQEWQRRVGRNAVPRIEAWVDGSGIVRQITLEIDGSTVTQTLVAGSSSSDRFAAPAPAPVVPVDSVDPGAPVVPVDPSAAPTPEPDVQPEADS